MAEVEISYKGSNIATMNASGTKTLLTEGKYLEDDVEVTYTRPAAPSGTKNISITQNGVTTEDVTNYANAQITANVPNTYAAADEGKVVSNGALVAQGSDTVTQNDTYDTTLISSLTVNVSGGGGVDINDIADGNLSGAITLTATNIQPQRFKGMTKITSVTAPNVTTLREQIFNNCTGLESISFAGATTVNSSQQFLDCKKLTSISMPSLQTAGGNMFQGCTALEFVDFPDLRNGIKARQFYGCSKLATVVLRRNAVISTTNDAFINTPLGSGGAGGTVYVPSAQIASYKTASNWSTLYNGGTVTFTAIEGSAYE